MYSVTELAYFAGIIDGEGSLSISMTNVAKYGRRGPFHTCQMNIVNTNKDLLDWIISKFGGHLYTRKKIKNRKQCYMLRIQTVTCETILKLILPYLIVKKRQAEVVLEFRSTFTGGHRDSITPEKLAIRTACYDKIKELNQVG